MRFSTEDYDTLGVVLLEFFRISFFFLGVVSLPDFLLLNVYTRIEQIGERWRTGEHLWREDYCFGVRRERMGDSFDLDLEREPCLERVVLRGERERSS